MAKQDSTAPFATCKWAGREPARMLQCQACLKATVLNEYAAGFTNTRFTNTNRQVSGTQVTIPPLSSFGNNSQRKRMSILQLRQSEVWNNKHKGTGAIKIKWGLMEGPTEPETALMNSLYTQVPGGGVEIDERTKAFKGTAWCLQISDTLSAMR